MAESLTDEAQLLSSLALNETLAGAMSRYDELLARALMMRQAARGVPEVLHACFHLQTLIFILLSAPEVLLRASNKTPNVLLMRALVMGQHALSKHGRKGIFLL